MGEAGVVVEGRELRAPCNACTTPGTTSIGEGTLACGCLARSDVGVGAGDMLARAMVR